MEKSHSNLFLLALLATNASAQNHTHQGGSKYGKTLYNWYGKFLRQGGSKYSTVLFNWDGTNIRSGESRYGNVIWTISGSIPTPLLIFLLYKGVRYSVTHARQVFRVVH